MITGTIRNKVDKICESIWAGGITNPLTVVEQFQGLPLWMVCKSNKGDVI